MNQYEEIAVLEEGEDGAIVSIRGQESLFVLLGPRYLGHLALLVRAARVRLNAAGISRESDPLAILCAEVSSLLETYDVTLNKFTGNPSAAKSLAEIQEEIEDLQKKLGKYWKGDEPSS